MAGTLTMKAVGAFLGTALLTSLIGTAVSGDPPWEWNIVTGWGLLAPDAVDGSTATSGQSTVAESGDPQSSVSAVSSDPAGTSPADEPAVDATPTQSPDAAALTASQQPAPDQGTAQVKQENGQPAVNAEAADPVVTPPPLIGAVVDLGSADSMPAQVYFGPAQSASTVLPAARLNLREGNPERCVLTAVFNGVTGSSAYAWAGFGYSQDGWGSGEQPPSDVIDGGNGAVHHEALTPPAATQPGYAIHADAYIKIAGGNEIHTELSYDLQLQAVDSGLQTWVLNGQTVRCRS